MALPSLYRSDDAAQPWRVARAALYGLGAGGLAALFKNFAPLRISAGAGHGGIAEIAGAALAFALLFAAAAMLRNFLARRLV